MVEVERGCGCVHGQEGPGVKGKLLCRVSALIVEGREGRETGSLLLSFLVCARGDMLLASIIMGFGLWLRIVIVSDNSSIPKC